MQDTMIKLNSFDATLMCYFVNEYRKEHPYCNDPIINNYEFNTVNIIVETINNQSIISSFFITHYNFSKNKYIYVTKIVEKDVLTMSYEEKNAYIVSLQEYRIKLFNDYFGTNIVSKKESQLNLLNVLRKIKK